MLSRRIVKRLRLAFATGSRRLPKLSYPRNPDLDFPSASVKITPRTERMEKEGLNREEWLEKLARVDQGLQRQQATARLTLVGSAAGILAGQPARTSIDLDVWKPKSRYQHQALKQAVEEAGLLFDPKSTLEPDKPYIQLLDPGIVQTGRFTKTESLEQFKALRLERPPIANLIAAKLLRAEPRDLEAMAFLLAASQPSRKDIERAVKTMPRPALQKATENLVYLDALDANPN